jgi:hypothetical protein
MTNFDEQIKRFNQKLDRRVLDTFTRSTEEVQTSIVDGSPVSGAPGQPKDTGALRSSWIPKRLEKFVWQTETPLKYAPAIEEGVSWYGPMTLRSEVGGFHSVKLTRAAWQKIVDHAAREVS